MSETWKTTAPRGLDMDHAGDVEAMSAMVDGLCPRVVEPERYPRAVAGRDCERCKPIRNSDGGK
jgi:hypothetical protein